MDCSEIVKTEATSRRPHYQHVCIRYLLTVAASNLYLPFFRSGILLSNLHEFSWIGNLGNIMLIIVPVICKQDGNPFGDNTVCSTIGLSYVSFSMAVSVQCSISHSIFLSYDSWKILWLNITWLNTQYSHFTSLFS